MPRRKNAERGRSPGPGVRVRRDRDEAQRQILEAAAKRLREGGPDAIRIQQIAADLRITDAAIHYHFSNRQGLLEALLRHGARELRRRIDVALESWDGTPAGLQSVVEIIAEAYGPQGYAQLALWLASAGWKPPGGGLHEPLVDAVHKLRLRAATANGATRPRRRETQHDVALLNIALAADPLYGPGFLRSVGLSDSAANQKQFRRWLVRRLTGLLTSAE